MHSRKKAAPKDSPYLKDIEPNDYAFGRHSVLQTHGPSGRPTMYIANHMHHLEYKTPRSKDFVPTPQQPYERVPEPEGTELIEKLLAHATQEKYVLSIEWQNEGDLVVWDNTAVMHKAGTGTFQEKYARDMRRATGKCYLTPVHEATISLILLLPSLCTGHRLRALKSLPDIIFIALLLFPR